jgi:hypothetical protein
MARDKLTALKVDRIKTPGRYGDGAGLYQQIRKVNRTISKSWIFRYRLAGHLSKKSGKPLSREMGLGPLADVSLAKAREKAAKCRDLVLAGKDPIETKQDERRGAALERAKAQTFKQCAEGYIRTHRAGWKDPMHAAQWPSTLKSYAYPVFGGFTSARSIQGS